MPKSIEPAGELRIRQWAVFNFSEIVDSCIRKGSCRNLGKEQRPVAFPALDGQW